MLKNKKIISRAWKKLFASLGLLLIAYGLILQGLNNSEAIILFFSCQCNHDLQSEKHVSIEKSDLKSIPDCHKKADVPHVCSCKNGKILKKLSDFLAQFLFINNSPSNFIANVHYIESKSFNKTLKSKIISSRLERPPSFN